MVYSNALLRNFLLKDLIFLTPSLDNFIVINNWCHLTGAVFNILMGAVACLGLAPPPLMGEACPRGSARWSGLPRGLARGSLPPLFYPTPEFIDIGSIVGY